MTHVVLQPAAGDAARQHYRDTIESPVPLDRIREALSSEDQAALAERYPDSQLFVWGVTPRSKGGARKAWKRLDEGDIALFTWDSAIRAVSKVTYKTENSDVARLLWGEQEDGRTWRYLFFLTEPEDRSVSYETFNEAAGFKSNYIPRGFNTLDEERSRRVLREFPGLQPTAPPAKAASSEDPVAEAFELFKGDDLESLRVKIRRYRAAQIRELVQSRSLSLDEFDREIWRIESRSLVEGEDVTGRFRDETAPDEDLVERVRVSVQREDLELHGNFHWRAGSGVFAAGDDDEERHRNLERALKILTDPKISASEKVAGLVEECRGFGDSTASGVVMLHHPDEYAAYNDESQTALEKLGLDSGEIEVFQEHVQRLRERVGAADFLELDRFIHLVANDRIYAAVDGRWPRVWWVNQGKSYREELAGGYVWAPTESRAGGPVRYHTNVAKLQLGDRVLHYADGALRAVGTVVGSPLTADRPEELSEEAWQREGYLARVRYDELDDPIPRDEIPHEWRLQEDGGPFTKGGAVQQGYLFRLSDDFSQKLVSKFEELRALFPVEPDEGMKPVTDLAAVVEDFGQKLEATHLTFGSDHDAVVRDFVVSLATKQLVILTGLSGSGKTQIAIQFGCWLGEDRYRVVPVRPDWTGSEALFGYPDALQPTADEGRRAWHVPGPLRFMLRAARDPAHPYLIVLDEMNLAHVERYFADVISGMESVEPCLPNLRKEEDGHWRLDPDGREKIRFPPNLFIAGTVNVDETTYMFSPKVLDRANTMEFTVETDDLSASIRKPGRCSPGRPELVRGFLEVAKDKDRHRVHPATEQDRFVELLKRLHRSLDQGYSFGHRVLYEAVRFAALHEAAGEQDIHDALDVQVMQKILPRLHGSRRRLEPVLLTVGKFCYDLEPADGNQTGPDAFDPTTVSPEEASLPRSFDKVRRMTERLRQTQFVSFTE